MTIPAKVGVDRGEVCLVTVAISITESEERRRVGLTTETNAADKTGKGVGVGTVTTSIAVDETWTSVCSETVESPTDAGEEHKPFSWDTGCETNRDSSNQRPSSFGRYETNTPVVEIEWEQTTSSDASGEKVSYCERVSEKVNTQDHILV